MPRSIEPGRGGALALAASAMLVACAGGGGPPRERPGPGVQAALLRPVAQPGSLAAIDLALARAAQESGQWSAFRATAAPGALLQLEQGPVDAATWTPATTVILAT